MASIQKLGKYELLEELGRGGFATVYQARDTHLGREVALKLIHGSHSRDSTFLERFQQEARTAANLHHPRLVTIYDFGEIEGQLYLAMRRVPGPSLDKLLAQHGRFSLSEALPLLTQLAEGLDYLHAHQFIHRDLKPANILLEGNPPEWQVTLADFGLVRSLASSQSFTQTTSILGTPAYLAPEQADPKRWGEVTYLTDIYALGILVYQMLTGRLPFEGEMAALLRAHASDEPVVPLELVPELGADLISLLLKALAKPVENRFPSAKALVEALNQVETQRTQRQTRQAELEDLMSQAKAAREKSNWLDLNQLCLQILERDRSHPDAFRLMAESLAGLQGEQAEESARWERQQLYEQGQQALEAQDWARAITAFERVAVENPGFRDVQSLLAQVQDELARVEAYNEAIAHDQAGDWPAASRTLLRVLEGRLDYREGEAIRHLLIAIERLLEQHAELQERDARQGHELDLLRYALENYDQMLTAIAIGDWESVIVFDTVLDGLPLTIKSGSFWLEYARQKLAEAEQRVLSQAEQKPKLPAKSVSSDRITWEKDGKEMVRVLAGEFLYGDNKEKRSLPEFWIDKTPVTNAEYARFVAETKGKPPEHWKGKAPPKDMADHPVTRISWDEAVAYAEWAGKRLPTEEEWEKAARGTDGRKYPWGDQPPSTELCNFNQNSKGTTPVGRYSPQGDSPYGCVDMAGNVWEWTASDYDKSNKVLRGGGWYVNGEDVRVAARHFHLGLVGWSGDFGFRCAVARGI